MNQFIISVCALAVMASSGLAGVKCCPATAVTFVEPPVCLPALKVDRCSDLYREPYRISYPNLCYFDKVYPSNTEIALRMRQEAILRQREILCFEKRMREVSPWNTDPASTGHLLPGSTDGAGAVPNPCAPVPPAPPYPGPSGVRVPAVGERDYPVAVKVPGRPGYVFCPFGTNYGCLCVKGIRSGAVVQDPFTKQFFRVP